MSTTANAPFVVLLVEDDPADAALAKHALKLSPYPCDVHQARDGVEALAFLRQQAAFAEAPPPHLVLLDLNMPRMDGREVLKEMKADAALKSIPVVVMTTSDVDWDINSSYLLGANSFVTKPIDVDEFTDIVKTISDYWLNVVQLPR